MIENHPKAFTTSDKVGHVYIEGVIGQEYYKEVRAQLDSPALKNATSLEVHIQSPGGSVYAGYSTYHVLKSAGKPIKTIIEGEAQSMATFISLAGDTIEIKDPSLYMIHNPSQGLEGDADALQGGADELRKIEGEMIKAYAERNALSASRDASVTVLSEDEIRKMMKNETRMTATEAKNFGFADKVSKYLTAVAIGKPMKEEKKNKLKELVKMVGELAGVLEATPAAIDLDLPGGKKLHVESENGDLVGKPATIDGVPVPDGDHPLSDGRIISVMGGLVKEVKLPAAPIEDAATTAQKALEAAQKQVADLTAGIQKAEADKLAAVAAQTKATEQVAQTATMLATIKKEVDAISKETIGDEDAPFKGMTPNRQPIGAGTPTAKSAQRERTMRFLNEYMPWIKQYYPDGEIEKYASGPNAVSILETNFNYTYPGILTTDIFYKPSLGNPAITDMVTIDQGIKGSKVYNLINPISKILKPYAGCDRIFNNNRAFITNTKLQTKEFQVNESWCKDDFTSYLTGGFNFLAQEWLKTGIDSFDPSGTPIDTIIDKVLSNALRIDVFRRFSFAAGNSSDDDYNNIDGFWDRMIDSSGASNYCVVRASATNGAGAVGFGTGALASGAALIALESAYSNSNILLKDWDNIYAQFGGQVQKPTFWVTRSVWDNYYNSLIGTGAVTEQAFENLQKGLTTLTYKGYPVRPVSLWDQFLAESDNPFFAVTRHLIAFTTKDNHILGVEQASDLNRIEGWYERKDRKFYYEADLKMGYQYLHCDLQTIVY